jgi:hypothetical protein
MFLFAFFVTLNISNFLNTFNTFTDREKTLNKNSISVKLLVRIKKSVIYIQNSLKKEEDIRSLE